MTAPVYIVHCIDTEGPLWEPLAAKFQLLKTTLGVDVEPKTHETFERLKRGDFPLGGKEEMAKTILAGHRTNTLGTWSEVENMLDRITAPGFRRKLADSADGGWIYNWFCLDLVGYEHNPRRRDLGYHNVFDRFRDRIAAEPNSPDVIHWHFHPISTYREAHACGTHYFRFPEIFEVLSRKIIERQWFPAVFRAGFQAERPDSHWFLEQYIPFDITNMAVDDPSEFDRAIDFRKGRSGDWRRAPADWSIYHPSHDDYQISGNCRRVIGRALNVMSRVATITQAEMDKAFARAAAGQPALVGLCSHDYRDIGTEVDFVRDLIADSRKRFPGVPFRFAEAREAFRAVLWPEGIKERALELELLLHPASSDDVAHIEVRTKSGKVFGPQPYLAIETKGRRFLTDNLDFSPEGDRWYYAFHHDTLALEDVARIGVGANDKYGNSVVKVLDFTKS
jgi:hypothetical protein